MSPTDVRRLTGYGLMHSHFCRNTLIRRISGLPVQAFANDRIEAAARELGIELPPAVISYPPRAQHLIAASRAKKQK